MRGLFCSLVMAAAAAGCVRFDPAGPARERDAIVAGGAALTTITTCLLHMERAGDTSVPECDASSQMRDYAKAKGRLKSADTPELQALDGKIDRARAEAMKALVAIAEESALK